MRFLMFGTLFVTACVLSRHGDEEFIVLPPDASLEDARDFPERLRRAISELAIPCGAAPETDSVSATPGVAAPAPKPPHSRIRRVQRPCCGARKLVLPDRRRRRPHSVCGIDNEGWLKDSWMTAKLNPL